jgi:hypothetical protein
MATGSLYAQGFLISDPYHDRTGMVFDFAGQNLYISTVSGLIKTFNLSTLTFGTTYNLGGTVWGIDIARDNSFILAAQDTVGTTQGTFQRVNLATGAITNIHYTRADGEGGGWYVAIGSNGLALVTTYYEGSGWTPLRQIDLSTNTITNRTDDPGSGGHGQVAGGTQAGTQIFRSADGTRFLLIEGNIYADPFFTYSALTNTFGPRFMEDYILNGGAMNRNGSLLALDLYLPSVSLNTVPNFGHVHTFDGIDTGVAFDAVHDILYGVNDETNQIVAYSTTTYHELFRMNIGESVFGYVEFDTGTFVASTDGHWLALETDSGIRLFHLPPPPEVTTNPAANVASFSATLNSLVLPRGLTTTAYFQYGPTTTYGFTTPMQTHTGNAFQPISANIAGLSAGTIYHFRIVAHNNNGTNYGSDMTFTTLTATGPPVVVTDPDTNIASFSATLNGSLDPHGLTTSVYFQYGVTIGYGAFTALPNQTGSTYRNISSTVSGLPASTTYHFRIVAMNSVGTTYGADHIFTTLTAAGPPVVTTNPANYIASFSANLNARVDPHGLSTNIYFQYATTTSYGLTSAAQTQSGNTYRNVTAGIGGLSANTTYHFRIVAMNSAGTTYGADQVFTTLTATGPPVVITNPATNVSSSSATLTGAVNPHGLTTSVHFQYGTTTSYGSTTSSQTKIGNTYQSVSANISGLSAITTYHFRSVGTNSAGTGYGGDRIFTTP